MSTMRHRHLQVVGPRTWIMEGSVGLIAMKIILAIPKGDYETISGYIFWYGRFQSGTTVYNNHFNLEILDGSTKVHRLKLPMVVPD